jgi:hypothetical protein
MQLPVFRNAQHQVKQPLHLQAHLETGEGEGAEGSVGGDDEYWDEEDDLENYLKGRLEGGADSSDDEGEPLNALQDRVRPLEPSGLESCRLLTTTTLCGCRKPRESGWPGRRRPNRT